MKTICRLQLNTYHNGKWYIYSIVVESINQNMQFCSLFVPVKICFILQTMQGHSVALTAHAQFLL